MQGAIVYEGLDKYIEGRVSLGWVALAYGFCCHVSR